jgi:hypothetical protein
MWFAIHSLSSDIQRMLDDIPRFSLTKPRHSFQLSGVFKKWTRICVEMPDVSLQIPAEPFWRIIFLIEARSMSANMSGG